MIKYKDNEHIEHDFYICESDFEYLPVIIGEALSYFRKKQKVTGVELAGAIGLTQQQISRYERGTSRLKVSTLFFILQYLNVKLPDFFSHLLSEMKTRRLTVH
ncbi:helix-turn-helix domain-containing protein [Morganella morganii]|nr:helix-turn-helix transcriptional regulator [Morganella morganii]